MITSKTLAATTIAAMLTTGAAAQDDGLFNGDIAKANLTTADNVWSANPRQKWMDSWDAKPRTVATFRAAKRAVFVKAASKRARGETAFARGHINECETMAKVMPGYPQPALLTVDVGLAF